MRKILALLTLTIALLAPSSALAADKTPATLPDRQLEPMSVYDLPYGVYLGTLRDVTYSGATIVQTSDTTSAIQGQLCGSFDFQGNPRPVCWTVRVDYTYELDCSTGTFRLLAYSPIGYTPIIPPYTDLPYGYQATHVGWPAFYYTFTAADDKDRKAICSAKEALTNPKKPPTVTKQVAILNDLIAELRTP